MLGTFVPGVIQLSTILEMNFKNPKPKPIPKTEKQFLKIIQDIAYSQYDLDYSFDEELVLEIKYQTDGHSGPGWYVWESEYPEEEGAWCIDNVDIACYIHGVNLNRG